MVRLVNPQIGETIYDPFCGTGGFLIESFRYIYNNMARTSANLTLLREHTVFGNEITNTARITKMNMILAGDGHSNIKMKDSLAHPIDGSETYEDEEGVIHHRGFDIVLANMPYSQKTKHGNLYDLPSTNGDGKVLISFCKGEYEGYDEPKDFITEQMIQSFKLSTKELLICNEMSVSNLTTEHRGYGTKLKEFKKAMTDYCLEMGYI